MPHVLTANRLSDGAVVYLTASGGWAERLSDGHLLTTPDAVQAAEAQGRAAQEALAVVGAYVLDVAAEGTSIRPLRMREIIRAAGPSVRLDLGKQAAGL
jgi:hypothetical protein